VKVLLATANRGKLGELRELFRATGVELLLPADAGIELPRTEETGDTYEVNARLKAAALAAAAGMPALADDSGLEVDALGGAPGIRSARFAGEGATDDENNRKLLSLLRDADVRTARFRCVLVLADPSGGTISAEGVLEGEIAREPRGMGGFGYDPVFFLPERGMHLAELSPAEKHLISHRGRAARSLADRLSRENSGRSGT